MFNIKNRLANIFCNQIVFALLGFAIIIALSIPLAKNLSKRYIINKEIKNLENEITSLDNRNLNIKKMIEYLQSDSYVKGQAKLNLNLKNEGENVVVIKNESKSAEMLVQTTQAAQKESQTKKTPNPINWWHYFAYK